MNIMHQPTFCCCLLVFAPNAEANLFASLVDGFHWCSWGNLRVWLQPFVTKAAPAVRPVTSEQIIIDLLDVECSLHKCPFPQCAPQRARIFFHHLGGQEIARSQTQWLKILRELAILNYTKSRNWNTTRENYIFIMCQEGCFTICKCWMVIANRENPRFNILSGKLIWMLKLTNF